MHFRLYYIVTAHPIPINAGELEVFKIFKLKIHRVDLLIGDRASVVIDVLGDSSC